MIVVESLGKNDNLLLLLETLIYWQYCNNGINFLLLSIHARGGPLNQSLM